MTSKPRLWALASVVLRLSAWMCLQSAVLVCAQAADADLADLILSSPDDWPGVYVKVPLKVYRLFEESQLRPRPVPEAPADWVIPRADYSVEIRGDALRLGLRFRVVVLNATSHSPVPLLPRELAWSEILLDGKPASLRQGDAWLYLDRLEAAGQGPFGQAEVTAALELRGKEQAGQYVAAVPVVRAAQAVLSVDSEQAWEVRSAQAPLALVGDEKAGTHGRLALIPTQDAKLLTHELRWRMPQPPVSRPGQVLYDSYVAWHLDEGVQEVRAFIDARIVGGELDALHVRLPEGADRVRITGGDVREARVEGSSATVHLRGRIGGAVRLAIEFAVPWSSRGKAVLNGPEIEDGRLRGGVLAVASSVSGAVLEEQAAGLAERGLWDLPQQVASLLSAPVALVYSFTGGPWQAGVEVVPLGELPVRETLIDRADYTVLVRPHGGMMCKLSMQVRNRNEQFLRFRLPVPDGKLVMVRVSGEPVPVSRTEAGELLVPLEKSIQTIAGGVSFPVELVYESRMEALGSRGRFSLSLPSADVPIAYAECSVYLPEGFRTDQWEGAFQVKEDLTAVVGRLEYGRGHLEPEQPPRRGLSERDRWLLLGENYFRAGLQYYQGGNLEEAEQSIQNLLREAPDAPQAPEAQKLLSNIRLLKDGRAPQGKQERVFAEQLKKQEAVRTEEQQARQQVLVRHGWEAVRSGDEAVAAESFRAAQEIGQRFLSQTEEGRLQQIPTLEKPKQWLGSYEAAWKENERLREAQRKLSLARAKRAPTPGGGAVAGMPAPLPSLAADAVTTFGYSLGTVHAAIPSGSRLGEHEGLAADDTGGRALAILGRLQSELERVQSTGANVSDWGKADEKGGGGSGGKLGLAANVAAPGLVATQRAAGKGTVAVKGPSVVAENVQLQKELQRGEPGGVDRFAVVGGKGGFATEARPEQVATTLQQTATELLRQGRLEEAQKLLESTRQVMQQVESSVVRGAGRYYDKDRADISGVAELADVSDLAVIVPRLKVQIDKLEGEAERELKQAPTVNYNVKDLAANEAEGRELALFLTRNLTDTDRRADGRTQTIWFRAGNLVVTNTSSVREQVNSYLENLRRNLKQKVTFNRRDLMLDEAAAADLGVQWNGLANGKWAVIDEGRLNALLALEQRAAVQGGQPIRGQGEIVPGTSVVLPNGVVVQLNMARDVSNDVLVNGAEVALPHDRILLVSSNGRLIVVRAGATQFWEEAPQAPEIREVPMEIGVPAVGVPAHFEKVLVRPEDSLVIQCSYTYKESAR